MRLRKRDQQRILAAMRAEVDRYRAPVSRGREIYEARRQRTLEMLEASR